MKTSTIFSLLAFLATAALSAPVSLNKRDGIDSDILQFALTLEHLENAFYKHALSTWSEDQFIKANFSANVYSQLKYIAHDEEIHVQYLEAGLKAAGAAPVSYTHLDVYKRQCTLGRQTCTSRIRHLGVNLLVRNP